MNAGDVEGSRRQIRVAVEAWPGIKGDLVEDRELKALRDERGNPCL